MKIRCSKGRIGQDYCSVQISKLNIMLYRVLYLKRTALTKRLRRIESAIRHEISNAKMSFPSFHTSCKV